MSATHPSREENAPGRLARTAFRIALRFYPPLFRARFTDSMLETFDDRYSERQKAGVPALVFCLRTIFHLVVQGLRERARPSFDQHSSKKQRDKRERKRGGMFGPWLTDLRQAVRRLGRSPGFTAAAIGTLALCIGANTALFSVVEGVLLRSLPFEQAERLVFLPRPESREGDVSVPDAADWRQRSLTLDGVALVLPNWSLDLLGGDGPRRVVASVVEPDWFDLLGVQAILGRILQASDNELSSDRVAVISEGFWRKQLGSEPSALGMTLNLSGEPWVIVGVLPNRADVFRLGTELWLAPATATPWAMSERGTNNFEAIGRLAAGVTLEEARIEMRTITETLATEYPSTNQGKVIDVVKLRSFLVGPVRPALLVLLGAVGLVLLIACVNLSSLMLVRTRAGEQERAIRVALGGHRFEVARPQLLEGLCLGASGCGLGVALAWLGTAALLRLAPATLPRTEEVRIDLAVLGFATVATMLATLLFVGLPALSWSRRDPAPLLGRLPGTSRPTQQGSLSALVVAEMALAFVLLIGAGLLLRSFQNLSSVDLGFAPEGILTANLVLPESRYADLERQTLAFEQIVEALGETPGVDSAAFVIGAPLDGFGAIGSAITFDDRPEPKEGQVPSARLRPMVGDYFATLGIPMLEGRGPEKNDTARSPSVVWVNRSFANRYWPEGEVLGKRVAISMMGGEPIWREVVGVVSDVKSTTLAGQDSVAIYYPYAQRQMPWARFGTLLARSKLDAEALAGGMREALWSVDPTVPLDRVESMDQRLSGAKAGERFLATLVALFAAVALMIALQGTYGVLSYLVAQRQHEIGVRVALGASTRTVLGGVLRRGLVLACAGLVLGVLGSLGLGRLVASLLFEVSPVDPATFLAVCFLLVAAAILACILPARRASQLDPIRALREE